MTKPALLPAPITASQLAERARVAQVRAENHAQAGRSKFAAEWSAIAAQWSRLARGERGGE